MIDHFRNIFTFIGGVGMFLYGMKIMSEGLQKVAGPKLANVLKFLTANKFMGILVGALVTIVMHSSAATTVMVVGFVNAGLMKLNEAVGVIMGANIGTTVTAWIIALAELGSAVEIFKPDFFAPIVFGISSLIVVFTKKEKTKTSANIFVGIGLLFIGLTLMSGGVSPYSKSKVFSDAFEILGKNPVLAILVGMIVTVILSSSTASVSILQTLALAGSVSKGAACFITVGQNVGTCVTTIISSANSSKNGKRTALLHLLFNVIGGLIFSVVVLIFYPLFKDMLATRISLFEISLFHTGFNLANTAILLPFSNMMVSMTKKIIPDTATEEEEDFNLSEKTQAILDKRILNQPALAISTVRREIVFYANYTLKNLKRAVNLILKDRNEELIRDVVTHEEQIDKTTDILVSYLADINNLSLSDEEHVEIEHLMSICSDIERIGDHAENISENAEQMMNYEVKFSESGQKEMDNITSITLKSVECAIKCINEKDKEALAEVRKYEEEVDDLEDIYRDNHIKRMSSGECNTIAGIVFLDIIGNLERVTDHANNLADYTEAEISKKVVLDKKY
ncbi:MAG: Na/Pi cotransporter family protein [Lachnospiraceae bacterium]|nr:Na/Pi cotransporter family protein [Lachnospiraceae bacterium]